MRVGSATSRNAVQYIQTNGAYYMYNLMGTYTECRDDKPQYKISGRLEYNIDITNSIDVGSPISIHTILHSSPSK